MMKKAFSRLFFYCVVMCTLCLSSCSLLGSLLSDIYNPSAHDATNGAARSEAGEGWSEGDDLLPISLSKLGESEYTAFLPSSGTTKILVLPIEFTDSPFEESTLEDIRIALSGTPEETGYWESVASFYSKSSFGKTTLEFEIADIYQTGLTQEELYKQKVKPSGKSYSTDNGAETVRNAVSAYKNKKEAAEPGYIRENFDVDENGWIDGIIAIYSGKDCKSGELAYDVANYYWAYTYWTIGVDSTPLTWTAPNKTSPTPNLFIWISYDFIYEAARSPKVDAHTLIHETGHMFGLDDYYPQGGSTFNAAGCWSMMDQNILDHDVFSKLILGWANPIVANGSGEIEINPSASSGDCILFPGSKWNGTAYDEYILLEYYTPTNLNYLDSHYRYPNRYYGYTASGIKIYHVDARLVERKKNTGLVRYSYVKDPKLIPSTTSHASSTGYRIGATNCQKDSLKADPSFSLLHLMEATGVNTFASGGYGGNDTLFMAGQSFSFDRFGERFFPKKTSLNGGSSFDYAIQVKETASNKAVISFQKL